MHYDSIVTDTSRDSSIKQKREKKKRKRKKNVILGARTLGISYIIDEMIRGSESSLRIDELKLVVF